MRSKEEASDYRYFPDPDLLPVRIEPERIERLRGTLPELPDSRRKRYTEKWGLPEYDAGFISGSREMSDYFETVVAGYGDAKTVSNWVMSELSRLMNQERIEFAELKIQPGQFAGMLKMIDNSTISGKIAKTVFEEMFATGQDPEAIVAAKGLVQINDSGALESVARRVLEANPQSVADYLAGKEKAIGFLVGQMMKETKGRANPGMVNGLLKRELEKLR
jgi:aspartyl-tRNA(Asn)/glutamyl-tRNA(Gln) amidotransferase subunit B